MELQESLSDSTSWVACESSVFATSVNPGEGDADLRRGAAGQLFVPSNQISPGAS